MKPTQVSEPARWRDADADESPLASRAAALAEAAKHAQVPAELALARIRSQVVAQRARAVGTGFTGLPRRAKLAVAVALLAVCATTAGGARALWRRYVDPGHGHALPAAGEAAPRARHSPARRSLVTRGVGAAEEDPPSTPPTRPAPPPPVVRSKPAAREQAPVEPAPVPRPQALRPSEQPALRAPRHAAAPAQGGASRATPAAIEPSPFAPAPPASSPRGPQASASEAALVAEALTELRQRRDARAALAALDRHARAFPRGVLEAEAFRTRVEAVVQLGDLRTALGLLDAPPAADGALGADLQLTRAELRAAAGRTREALLDFTELVDGGAGPLAAGGDERALYGRGVCLERLGQHDRARAALLAYSKRFPDGRFAAEVARLLAEPTPAPAP